ncbi:MAG: hypothetical protein R3C97_09995 [Geminicoccaceae bacterium]
MLALHRKLRIRPLRGPVSTLSLVLAAVFLASPAAAEPTGKMLAETCYICHGTDGRSPGEIDSIGGDPAEDLVKDFREYRSGKDDERIMTPVAQGYTDAQVAEIAKYLLSLRSGGSKEEGEHD